MKRKTWKRSIDGYEDVGLCDGISEGDAICDLAAYEDTDLEPEEIKDFMIRWKDAVELAGLCKEAGIDRLRELAEADSKGMCVVLPCKVGDTVYEALFEWDCTECLKTSFKPKVRERKVTHFMFGKRGDIILGVAGDGADYLIYGKTVFLTRAEAEEALKAGDTP